MYSFQSDVLRKRQTFPTTLCIKIFDFVHGVAKLMNYVRYPTLSYQLGRIFSGLAELRSFRARPGVWIMLNSGRTHKS